MNPLRSLRGLPFKPALAGLVFLSGICLARADGGPSSPDARFAVGRELAADDFTRGLGQWSAELERGGRVAVREGALDIDVPRGCSVWFKRPFNGPVMITYEATLVSQGGANDRVSDLNCFWMARDSRTPENLFASHRSGKFSDYDVLRCYYVGLGGNANTTTRFRRYVGKSGDRPLLPQHDLTARADLLTANVAQRITLIAAGSTIGYYRDGKALFTYDDPSPYESGWFAFRTVESHIRIRDFRVYRLVPR